MTVSEGDVRNAKHPSQQSVDLSMGVKDIHFYSSFFFPAKCQQLHVVQSAFVACC